ncbi:MAG: penicillin-binding transpeptidase domain-containing protein [Methylacidiphilales bacterium]|nr:penicillin-binding transpeptidase domain-containing protein [Candidatus Methylacidiphilales bacterium]
MRAKAYDLKHLDDFNVTSVFYDRSGEEIGRLFVEDRTLLKHDDIPDRMRQATLAVEDKRFYSHKGIDRRGIFRALCVDLKTGKQTEGASTITQQLAKHLIGNFEKTMDRKLVEAFLAARIEHHFTKAEILDHYLNRIYFGKGDFGLAAAAQGYFGKKAKDLTVSECALLAGIIKAPNSSSPRNNAEAALKRRDHVIALMAAQKMLSSEEATAALQEPLKLIPEQPLRVQSYFMALAIRELREVLKLEEGEEIPQGLSVQTTLDARMQRASELQTAAKLKDFTQKAAPLKLEDNAEPSELQAAALVLDLNSGAVRVLIGGRDYEKSPFDRARMARRENGALLQPFLYSLAFERLNLHPASMINASFLDDAGKLEEVGLGDPKRDLGRRFLMIQDALALSNKACATRVGLQLGTSVLADWLASAEVAKPGQNEMKTSPDFEPLTLYEITSLYQMLGNGGLLVAPYSIESVSNDRGEILYHAGKNPGKPLLEPLVARQMTLCLQSVTRDGTASMLSQDYSLPSPVVGMTGYSEGYRDAWFVGYTPSLVGGVWVGFDKSIPIGSKSLASKTALPIWGNMMQKILGNDPQGVSFPVPESLSKVEVDRRSGVIKGLGFLTVGSGNLFVYLRQDQLNQAKISNAATQVEQPKDWSDWLSTMFANPTGETPSTVPLEETSDGLAPEIPLVAEYRMPALRGDILTADGEVLATMTQSQNLVLGWPALEVANGEDEAVAWIGKRLILAHDWLKEDFDITDADLHSLHRFRRFHPILVAENLSPAQIDAFPMTSLQSEGFSLQGVPRRIYPHGNSLAHSLGYLQRKQGINRKHYQAGEVIYDDYLGAAGLEERFDKELRGQEGHLTIATTPEGFARAAVVDSGATAGAQLRTTIDSQIQHAAERAFEGTRTGAAVVMNIQNGDILGMVSNPTFDPNSFIPKLSTDKWQAMIQAAKNPLLDRVYREQNPPGSSFKVATTLAAIRAGVFDPNRLIQCPGYFDVGGMRYELPHEKGAPITFRAGIAHSYNTYFFDLGERTGRDPLIAMAQELGFGQSTGFILPGELPGLIPTPEFVRVTHKRTMGGGDVANMSIGQGDVLVTPLQMANLMCVVANGGTLYRPRLVKQLEDSSGKTTQSFPNEIIRKIPFSSTENKILIDGLVAVTEEGTGGPSKVPGIKVAAKTGTAQVGSKTQPRQIAWMIGFLPAGEPRYAFAVMIEGDLDQDLHGGADAGLIAGKLFTEIFAKPSSPSALTTQE